MSYLGNNPNKGSFFQQKFTGDGSTTAFTLLQSVTDGSQLIVTIGNVIQEEGNGKAYTASGTTLTFDSAPANNDAIVVRYLGRSLDTPTTYATQITYKYVATNAQTAFSGSDANGNTLSYTIGSVDVYLNGVHLDTTDFTETNESTITLASGATTNDELVIVAKRTITLTDVVPKSAGGTFAGDVIAGGALTVNGAFTSQGIDDNADATAITIDSSENVTFASNITAEGGDYLFRNSSGNSILSIIGNASNSSILKLGDTADFDIGQIEYNHGSNYLAIKTNDSERMRIDSTGRVQIGTSNVATDDSMLTLQKSSTAVEFNIISSPSHASVINLGDTGDYNICRIKGDNSNNSLQFQTNNAERMRIDSSGNVGILNTSPSSYGNASELVVGSHSIDDAGITIATTTNSSARIQFSDNTSSPFVGAIEYAHSNNHMFFYTDGNQVLKITNNGFMQSPPTAGNTTSASSNMHVTVGGEFAKSTSSERYKNTINDATHGLAELLKLRSVTYKGNNDGDTIFGGLIAEEVHDAGLTEFVVYDEEDRPDALHYPHMIALCVKAIQELEAKVKELGGK